jgi:tRNA uridine 5-carboxymethylaminomethyl modification enzyme
MLDLARRVASESRLDGIPAIQKLRRPDFSYEDLPSEIAGIIDTEIWELIEADAKCEGYARRHADQNRWVAGRSGQRIPDGLDFSTVRGLSAETLQRLKKTRPTSIGQAARISGITPADIAILSIWLNKNVLYV